MRMPRPSSSAWLAILPVVIATGRNLQATAHQSYRILVAAALDHRAPLDDSLVNYAAASLKKSPSLVTRANSRLRRASFSFHGLPALGNTFSTPGCDPLTQCVSGFGATPISRDTCRQFAPERRTRSTAASLNSGSRPVSLALGHEHSSALRELTRKCPC